MHSLDTQRGNQHEGVRAEAGIGLELCSVRKLESCFVFDMFVSMHVLTSKSIHNFQIANERMGVGVVSDECKR